MHSMEFLLISTIKTMIVDVWRSPEAAWDRGSCLLHCSIAHENLRDMTQAKTFTDKVMFLRLFLDVT